jgi:biotin operon repressor
MNNCYKEITSDEMLSVKLFFLKKPSYSHLKEIADYTGMQERKVTSIVQELRKEGVPVLSNRKYGFWLSEDEVEIKQFIIDWENETKRRFLVIKEMKRKYIKQPKNIFQKLFN